MPTFRPLLLTTCALAASPALAGESGEAVLQQADQLLDCIQLAATDTPLIIMPAPGVARLTGIGPGMQIVRRPSPPVAGPVARLGLSVDSRCAVEKLPVVSDAGAAFYFRDEAGTVRPILVVTADAAQDASSALTDPLWPNDATDALAQPMFDAIAETWWAMRDGGCQDDPCGEQWPKRCARRATLALRSYAPITSVTWCPGP